MKTALITGATGGIGSEVAAKLSAEGYKLVLSDLDGERLAVQKERYADAEVRVVDMSDQTAVREFCDEIEDGKWDLDVAFINAGVIEIGDLNEISPAQMDVQLQVNLIAAAHLIQALSKRMVSNGRGHIMATVSMGGIVSLKGSATYSASKFGLRGLLWGLRDELSSKGVQVTGIYPAGVDTPMLRHEARHGGSSLNFVGTPVTVHDISRAVLKALKNPRLEVYVPYSESVSGRFAGAFPWVLSKTYPLFEWLGERGRRSFLKRIGDID